MPFYRKAPLGKRLMLLREEMNYSQKEFSEFLAMPPASISAYENGRNSPTLEVLVKIAQKCNVSIDWLCGLSASDDKAQQLHKALLIASRTLADSFYLPGQDDDESERIRTTRWYDQLMEQAASEAVCRVCGCTEGNACGDGCYWVEDDLCSSCAEAELETPGAGEES